MNRATGSQLKLGPCKAGGSNPSRRHGSTGQVTKGKSSTDASRSDAVVQRRQDFTHKASRQEVVSGDRGHGAGRARCKTAHMRERAKKAPPGTKIGQSNALVSVSGGAR